MIMAWGESKDGAFGLLLLLWLLREDAMTALCFGFGASLQLQGLLC